jgi:hypothetical protein
MLETSDRQRRVITLKGKPWAVKDEKLLQELVKKGQTVEVIAARLKKTPDAVKKKINRLGLEVVASRAPRTTTSVESPEDLPSVEQVLKELAGALALAKQPGLDKVEVQRLQAIATLARTYKEMLVDYAGYREIERKLVELEVKYAKLLGQKVEGIHPKSNPGTMA